MLDSKMGLVTMSALLYLRNDEYTVRWCASVTKVAMRCHRGGKVFEVIGFAEGERKLFSGGSKEIGLIVN